MDALLLIGISGMLFILVAFLLNLFNFIIQDSILYCSLNILGSFLLGINAYYMDSLPFLILEIVWFISSFYNLMTVLFNDEKGRRPIHLSPLEMEKRRLVRR